MQRCTQSARWHGGLLVMLEQGLLGLLCATLQFVRVAAWHSGGVVLSWDNCLSLNVDWQPQCFW